MNTKVKEIRDKFVEDSNQAKAKNYRNHVIESLSEREKEAVKLIASIDDMTGGNLPKLYQAYMYIKQSN